MHSASTIDAAHRALPHLVEAAQQRRTLTYSELGARIGRNPRSLGRILSYVQHDVCQRRGVPLLSALVVSKATGLPGDGFAPHGTPIRSSEERARVAGDLQAAVFAYEGWSELLRELEYSEEPGES